MPARGGRGAADMPSPVLGRLRAVAGPVASTPGWGGRAVLITD